MKRNEVNLVYGNYKNPDLIADFLIVFKRYFESRQYIVHSSKKLKSEMINIVIEEFCHDPNFINEIREFKMLEKGQIVVLLTEFLTGEHLNAFSNKSMFLNKVSLIYFKALFKTKNTNDQMGKISKPSLNFLEKKLVSFIQHFKSDEINIANDLAEINYQQRRLNGIKYVEPFVDLWIGLYKSQVKEWKRLLNPLIVFNFSQPNYKINSNKIKKYDFFFSGKLTRSRKKLLDELSDHFKVAYPESGYISSYKRDTLIKNSKFVLCLPRGINWPYSSCVRSWNALDNGAIPVNLRHFELSGWESKLNIARVSSFNVVELKKLLENYASIKNNLIKKLEKPDNFNSKQLAAYLETV